MENRVFMLRKDELSAKSWQAVKDLNNAASSMNSLITPTSPVLAATVAKPMNPIDSMLNSAR